MADRGGSTNASAQFEAFDLAEMSDPADPPTGMVRVYAGADGLVYGRDDAGTETKLSNVAGGGIKQQLYFQATNLTPVNDAATLFFGDLPKVPQTTNNISKVFIRQSGTINIAQVHSYATTAGSNESWTIYLRHNNTTDYSLGAVASNANERTWTATGLGISVSAGDWIEIKSSNPTWGTNPNNIVFSGFAIVE